MSVDFLRRAWCSLRVTFRVVVRGSLVYTAPLLPSCILGSCLRLGIFVVLLLVVVGSSGLVLAVLRVLPLLSQL